MDDPEYAPATVKVENDDFDVLRPSEPNVDEDQSESSESRPGKEGANKSIEGTTNNCSVIVESCADFSDEEYFIKTEVDSDSENVSNDIIIHSRVPLLEETTVIADSAFEETEIPIPNGADLDDLSASQDSSDPLACPHGDSYRRQSTRVRKLPKKLSEAEVDSHGTVLKLRKITDLLDIGRVNINDQPKMLLLHNMDFTCGYCKVGFPSTETLRQHLKEVHSCSESYSCDQCPNVYDSIASLKKHCETGHLVKFNFHWRKHEKGVSLSSLSKSAQPSKSYRTLKWNVSQVPITKAFKCYKCFCQFESTICLNRHVRNCKREELVTLSSPVSNNSPSLVASKITKDFNFSHQETNVDSRLHLECPPSVDSLTPSNHGQDSKRPIQSSSCPKCSRSFRLPCYLKLHLRGDCSKKIIKSSQGTKKGTHNRISNVVNESAVSCGEESKTLRSTLEHLSLKQSTSGNRPKNSLSATNTSCQQPCRGQRSKRASTKKSSSNSKKNSKICRRPKKCSCLKCPVKVKVKTQLQSRLRSHAKTSKKEERKMKTRANNVLKIEMPSPSHLPTAIREKYPGPKCSVKFRLKTGLNSHLRSHAEEPKTEEKKRETHLKGVEKLKSEASSTSRIHSSARGKSRYVRSKCPKKSSPTHLKSHLRVHARKDKKAEVQKLAKKCQKFRHKTGLNSKVRSSAHSDNERGIFSCLFCSAVLPYKVSLERHYRKFHPHEKPFVCHLCPSKFARDTIFRNHLYTVHGERKYECDECKARFKSKVGIKSHLKRHELSRLSSKPFICSECQSMFRTKGSLTKHLIKVHDRNHIPPRKKIASNGTCFNCPYCPRGFLSQTALNVHWNKKHFKENPFSCWKCSRTFSHSLHLKLHEKGNCNSTLMKCLQCPKAFTTLRGLRLHRVQKHSKNSVECPECKIEFAFQKILDVHVKQVHLGVPIYRCPNCPLKFRSTEGLKCHSFVHSGGNPYLCEICALRFPTITCLNAHKVSHKEDRTFECEHCSAKFKRKSNLQTHLDTHSDKKTHSCKLCSMKFKTPAHLRQHSVKHSGERPFACDLCPKTFGQISTLQRHKMRHTGEKPFSCDLCSACFVQKGNLQTHMKIHLNEKPYKCTHCSLNFRQKGHLQVHERKHKAEKPFQCHLCKARFRQERNMLTHMKRKHLKTNSKSEVEEEEIDLQPELKFLEDSHAASVEFKTISESETEGVDSSAES